MMLTMGVGGKKKNIQRESLQQSWPWRRKMDLGAHRWDRILQALN